MKVKKKSTYVQNCKKLDNKSRQMDESQIFTNIQQSKFTKNTGLPFDDKFA